MVFGLADSLAEDSDSSSQTTMATLRELYRARNIELHIPGTTAKIHIRMP